MRNDPLFAGRCPASSSFSLSEAGRQAVHEWICFLWSRRILAVKNCASFSSSGGSLSKKTEPALTGNSSGRGVELVCFFLGSERVFAIFPSSKSTTAQDALGWRDSL